MAKKTTTDADQALEIPSLTQSSVRLRLIGTTPMFCNRMSAKAKQQLLVGGRKKTAADRMLMKHAPLIEYRDSMEILREGPTALGLRTVAVKAAMATAAIETAGITKTSAQRLLFLPGELTALYGVPQLRMDIVRSADINRTPDVRTRAFLPQWGAEIEIRYVTPQLSIQAVATLLNNAGLLIGLGDFRQEKGKGAFGSFRVLGDQDEDEEWQELVACHGRPAQQKAIDEPVFADAHTADLMAHFFGEQRKRAA